MGQLQLRVLSGKGKGGQGAVFEAEVAGYSGSNKALQELNKQSDSVQRRVALKVLLRFSDLSEQAAVGWSAGGWLLAGLRSFSVEVEAAQRCEVRDPSGYVLRVHAIGRVPMFTGQPGGEWQPRPALILEYAAGGTVRDQLEAHGGKLDWDPQQASHKAWVVAKRMLRGLRVASKSQVVHRDCKPENVFLLKQDDLESAKMGDFGYSFLAEEAGSRGTTLVYTPGYEAPEVIGKMSYGTEMDVWMLGCSLLTMLTGQEPFYHAAQLPAKERAALRCGSELVRADSPYCDPNHPDYDQVGRHLTKTERETLQKLLEPDHRYRILLRQVNALPYFIYGPSGQFVQAEPFKA
jgi:serine/threonine protein kinase